MLIHENNLFSNRFSDNLIPLCSDILRISLTNLKILDNDSFVIIELYLKSERLNTVEIGMRKLQQDCNQIEKFVPKTTILLLMDCLNSSDHNIAPASICLLIHFLSDNLLDDPDIKHRFASTLQSTNTEASCRLYELSIGIAIKQYASFEKVQFVIDKALNDLASGDDVLVQLNLLEMLQSLCIQDYGFSYLEKKGVLMSLAKKVEQVDENPLANLMIPGLIKFFGVMASYYPQKIFQSYSPLFHLLFSCLLENQSNVIHAALDTLGHLSKSDECKKSIDKNFGQKVPQVLAHIYRSITNYPNDVKIRAFNCLENVFSIDDQEMLNNQIVCLSEKFFLGIFESFNDFSSLLNFCKTPFNDLSFSAFNFLKSLAIFPFGQKSIAKSAGFIEFLLDRKIGVSFEVKQVKYEVVEILSRSSIFDGTTIAQFCKYVREGVNFVEPMSEVSFETS